MSRPRPCILPLLLAAFLAAGGASFVRAGNPYGSAAPEPPSRAAAAGPAGDCGRPLDPVVNCGFEAPTLTGWQASDINNPLVPLMLVGEGYDTGYGFGFFLASPTQGVQALLHGFDGSGPGAIELAQDVPLHPLTTDLVFDYRAAWDLLNYGPALQARQFRVVVEPEGGGAALLDTLILQANPDTRVADTGSLTGRVDLEPFAGQTVRVVFRWWIPESSSGPGQFQLDDVFVEGPTLQRFLDLAAPGDTAFVPPLVWSGSGNVNLDFGGKDVVLLAVAGPDSTVIDCGDSTRAFLFAGGETAAARVEGFTVRRGRADGAAGGAVRIDGASPRFRNCVFDSSVASTGGAVAVLAGSPAFVDCRFTDNAATGDGGALFTQGAVTVATSAFDGNTADGDGGAAATADGGGLTLDASTITGNLATRGGGLHLAGGASDLTGTDLLGNQALGAEGAALRVASTAPVTITGGSIRGNTGSEAIRVAAGGLDLQAVDLAGHAGDGVVASAPVTVADCILAGHAGAAIVLRGAADLLLRDSRLSGNRGAVRADSAAGTWTIDGCTLAGNSSPDQGGAVRISAGSTGTLAFTGSIVWGNDALGAGAELWCGADGVVITVDDSVLRLGKVFTAGSLLLGGDNVYWDPVFCAPLSGDAAPTEAGDYSLAANSPATAANHPGGVRLGAEPVGCSFGSIASIEDVPNDQGRQVYVTWERALQDDFFADEPITQYSLWRRIDPPGPQAAPGPSGSEDAPPGNWAFLFTVPASAQATYTALAPTACDSTVSRGLCETVFLVRAHTETPAAVYDSPPDSGYSLDNLAPAAPENVAFQSPGMITWDPVPDPDRKEYSLYGSSSPVFDSEAVVLMVTSTESASVGPTPYAHFFVSAIDSSGNEGPAAGLSSTVSTPEGEPPLRLALHAASPNPFRASTRIAFALPGAARVRLEVFDLAGRSVRVLEDGLRPAGRHAATWDGRSDAGTSVPSGVYFVRFVADGRTFTGKLLRRR